MLDKTIDYLRSRSPEAKSRIVTAVTAVAVVTLGWVWLNGSADMISGLTAPQDQAEGEVAGKEFAGSKLVTVEFEETSNGVTRIFFQVTNDTDELLNLPTAEDIEMSTSEGRVRPTALTDRQGNLFPKKALSRTKVFGIAEFAEQGPTDGELTFGNMSYENSKSEIFRERIRYDLEELGPLVELRS